MIPRKGSTRLDSFDEVDDDDEGDGLRGGARRDEGQQHQIPKSWRRVTVQLKTDDKSSKHQNSQGGLFAGNKDSASLRLKDKREEMQAQLPEPCQD